MCSNCDSENCSGMTVAVIKVKLDPVGNRVRLDGDLDMLMMLACMSSVIKVLHAEQPELLAGLVASTGGEPWQHDTLLDLAGQIIQTTGTALEMFEQAQE